MRFTLALYLLQVIQYFGITITHWFETVNSEQQIARQILQNKLINYRDSNLEE